MNQECHIKKTIDGFDVWFPVDPVPASRPIVTRQGFVFYGKRYTLFRKQSKVVLGKTDFPKGLPLVGCLRVILTFFVLKPRTSKRSWPVGDLDNYLKTLDVFNEILWVDDDQICEFIADKKFTDHQNKVGILLQLRPIAPPQL